LNTPRRPRSSVDSERESARFVTVVHLAGTEELAVDRLSALWRVVAALGPAVARVVVIDRRAAAVASGSRISGLEVSAGDPSRTALDLVRAQLATNDESASRAVLVTSAELVDWPDEEIESIDDFAARAVAHAGRSAAAFGETAGGGTRPGALLLARPRLDDLAPLLEGRTPAVAPWSFAALRRLRDLEVAPSAIGDELVAGLGRVRSRLVRHWPGARPIVAIDRVDLPRLVAPGSPTRVVVEGWVVDLPAVRRLVLRVGDRRYPFAVDRERPDVAARSAFLPDDRCGFRFAGRLRDLAPGRHAVELERLDGRRLRRLGQLEIVARTSTPAPEGELSLQIARCEWVSRPGEASLCLTGVLAGAATVDSLRIELDGRRAFDVDRRRFLPDRETGDPSRLEFEVEELLPPPRAEQTIRVVARRGQTELAAWTAVLAPPEIALPAVRIVASGLEALALRGDATIWGALRLDGELVAPPPGADVELWIDGERAAATEVNDDGSFFVRQPVEADRELDAELRVAGSETRSRTARLRSRRLATPETWPRAIDLLRETLGEAARPWDAIPTRDLADRLAEVAFDDGAAFGTALLELAGRAEQARVRPARIETVSAAPAATPERRLRVLLASWEIPWVGHGGGAHLLRLLDFLATRHEVTLLHPEFPGAEGLSEGLRDRVHQLLTVPRGWRAPAEPRPFGVPRRVLQTYSPELTRALAAELASGAYDLLNAEGSEVASHLDAASTTPRLVAPLELRSFGELAAAPKTFDELEAAARSWHRLVAALHYETTTMAGRVDGVVTLAAPEAELLASFLPAGRLWVNPIAVDVEGLAAAARRAGARQPASFVFVGTYRHPPNLDAARELIAEIAPALRAAVPAARVALVGADPPPELVDAASRGGVELLGWVDDLPALLGAATGFLAPLRHGGGMRVKLLEAMACGCPIVTTGLGMSGIAARDGESFLRAESVAEFVAAAAALAGDPDLGSRLGREAAALVARHHGVAVQGRRRERIWMRLVEKDAAADD